MSKQILAKELHLIRERLDAIEEALGEQMTTEDKKALDEALEEHREGKTIRFLPTRSRNRKRR
jgi:hypothetical protein